MNMKRFLRLTFWLVILGSLIVAARGRAQEANGNQPANRQIPGAQFAGIWNANTDGLPAATIVLTEEGGSLTGAILFYIHKRETPEMPYSASAGLPEPMFNLKVEGDALTFQVSHRRAHPPRTLPDPPVTLRLKLVGNNSTGQMQAELSNVSERSPAVIALRSDD